MTSYDDLVSWEDRSGRIDGFSGVVIWRQVAEDIQGLIESGELAPGSKLPGEQELAGIYGIARVTVRRAVEDLRDRGLIVTAWGKGSYIKPVS